MERRAIQLGLRGDSLVKYAGDWIVDIEDISDFVSEQHENARSRPYAKLLIPREEIYSVADSKTKNLLGVSTA